MIRITINYVGYPNTTYIIKFTRRIFIKPRNRDDRTDDALTTTKNGHSYTGW